MLQPPTVTIEDPKLEAWRAATLLVPQYFGGRQAILAATSRDEIQPDIAAITESLNLVTFEDEAYLVALLSTSLDPRAQRLVEQNLPLLTIGRLRAKLGPQRRAAIARLLEAE
jgi:hypothetical protein